jgi:hypothetical protein
MVKRSKCELLFFFHEACTNLVSEEKRAAAVQARAMG